MFTARKVYHFSASHRLESHDGKSANPHGHNYTVTVEIMSRKLIKPPSIQRDKVIDFSRIDDIFLRLIKVMDHTYLNQSLEINPSCEALAKYFHDNTRNHLETALRTSCNSLYGLRITVHATPDLSASYEEDKA